MPQGEDLVSRLESYFIKPQYVEVGTNTPPLENVEYLLAQSQEAGYAAPVLSTEVAVAELEHGKVFRLHTQLPILGLPRDTLEIRSAVTASQLLVGRLLQGDEFLVVMPASKCKRWHGKRLLRSTDSCVLTWALFSPSWTHADTRGNGSGFALTNERYSCGGVSVEDIAFVDTSSSSASEADDCTMWIGMRLDKLSRVTVALEASEQSVMRCWIHGSFCARGVTKAGY